MSIFTGSGTALCTPFNAAGEFHYDTYEKMIRYQIENGTDAIISCGTTGEVSTLCDREHVEVVRAAVEITAKLTNGGRKVPVIAGAGGNDTRHCIELGHELVRAGADACMLVTPYYNKSSQRGMVEHFTKIAIALDVPIVVYNVPSRTGFNLQAKTVYEMSKVENISAVKEASGNIAQVAEIIERCGDAITVYSGNDEMVVPVLSLGGQGVITTVGNIAPRQMHDMVMQYLEGDVKASAKLQLEMMSLIRSIFADVNPMPVKAALNLIGFEAGECRAPLTTIDEALMNELKEQMIKYGLNL